LIDSASYSPLPAPRELIENWESRMRHTFSAFLLLLPMAPNVVLAQGVTGIVAELNTAKRLVGAELLLFDTDSVLQGAVYSGENGEFFVEASQSGTYTLEVRHLGYKGRSATLVLQTGKVIEVRVNLAPEATELEGITVYGQTAETPEQREFLSRRYLPWNYTFDMEEIERLHAMDVIDIVDRGVPGGIDGIRCYYVYLDGRPSTTGTGVDLEYKEIPIGWVYGLEVYRTYLDIPIKYRDPTLDTQMRCGALLIWSTVAPGAGLPAIWAFGLGASVGLERGALDLSWRRSIPDRWVTTLHARTGEYDPYDLLGRAEAAEHGYDAELRPAYASAYIGRQGPALLLPWKRHVFMRAAAGMSVYGGQGGETSVEADTVVTLREDVSPYFGLGAEFAIGVRVPSGKVRPWLELRTGTEYLTLSGFRWLVPLATIGIEFGGDKRR
jgi:hypothetical protein